jgi:3-isopropylmalate/(R)-2-methylmalate dehydratase large subunit
MMARTMYDKIWEEHVVAGEAGEYLLYGDIVLVHEGHNHAFTMLDRAKRKMLRPKQIFSFSDHYVPTTGREKGIAGMPVAEIRNMVIQQQLDSEKHGIRLFGFDDPRQGILHIVPPELGLTQPGMVIYGGDSHTATHGAFGCLAFGIGMSEMMHSFATQMTWQRKSKNMRITVDGALGFGVSSKDVILAIIAKIGAGGGVGYVIEYAGSTFERMSMEARMTVCNMSIEGGARAGLVAPDDKTYEYLEGRPYAPKGSAWRDALAYWKAVPSDAGAVFDKEAALDATQIAPIVTWGTNPEQALPVTATVPDPDDVEDEERRSELMAALSYMGLQAGMPITDIVIDRVFIGSCTNSRIEDIRAAAEVARLGRAKVPTWVVPGSKTVKRQAESEGLDKIFIEAGFEWREPGCSMCTAINGDQLKPKERCASTSNRNFRGRQGTDGRTHLLSPAMAAAAAIAGRLTDVRQMMA